MTLTELRAEFLLLKRDLGNVGVPLFIQWANYVARAYRQKLAKTDPEQLILTQDYTITTSPSSQAEPTDFANIQPDTAGFLRVGDDGDLTDDYLVRTGPGRSDRGYWWSKSSFNFTGITGETYKLRYITKHTEYTSMDDEFIVPEKYSLMSMDGLDLLFNQWSDKSGAESLSGQRFLTQFSEVFEDLPKEPRVFEIPDLSSAF